MFLQRKYKEEISRINILSVDIILLFDNVSNSFFPGHTSLRG